MSPPSEGLEAEQGRPDGVGRRMGFRLGPLLSGVILLIPTGLTAAAHRLSAVMALVIVYWITEALPLAVTALLGPVLAVALGVARAREALAPFADPVIFLFLGSFLLAEGCSPSAPHPTPSSSAPASCP